MAVDLNIYNDKFFDNTIRLESGSAKSLVEILVRQFNPESVIDIGCGVGIYLKEFENYGIEIAGYEGSPAAVKKSLVGNKIRLWDLSAPLSLEKYYDLCLCIEVAEHIENRYSQVLAKTLTGLSDTLFFTAATPGQGPRSIGHINEQPHQFWIGLFSQLGYSHEKKLSDQLRVLTAEEKVVWWIVKNLMVFKKNKK